MQGRVVFNLFFENSTRTRTSFSLAAKRLSADVQDFSASVSSLTKGETFIDTAKNIEAMGADVLVVRHPTPGAPHLLSQHVKASIINAGDGAHEHPTQGLLDLLTIRRAKGTIEGLTVGLIGDIGHSRVARSNIWGLLKLGAKVILCGPPTLVPRGFERLGCEVAHHLDEILPRCDVVNALRIQLERQERGLFPSLGEYSHFYGLTQERLDRGQARPPGPRPRPDQPRSRAHPRGRRRPPVGDPRPGHQRPGRPDGRALPGQRQRRNSHPVTLHCGTLLPPTNDFQSESKTLDHQCLAISCSTKLFPHC